MYNTSIHCKKDLLSNSKRGLVSPNSTFISIVTSETKPLDSSGKGEGTYILTYDRNEGGDGYLPNWFSLFSQHDST